MSLSLEPIGIISTPYADRYRAPRQPGAAEVSAEGSIILAPGRNFEQALEDLEGFEHIWVIYWFHRNRSWKPKVLPPRGPRRKRGVFATRSPHRPNPIGLSLLRLLGVSGRVIRVGDVDLLDGTPVLDIKPYLPYAEAFPGARAGWLDPVMAEERERAASDDFFSPLWEPPAAAQAAWLLEHHRIDLRAAAEPLLRRDPSPHPYRRITPRDDGGLVLALKSWRLLFHLEGTAVVVERVASGYSPERIATADPESLHDEAAHREFHRLWPEPPGVTP